MFYRDIKIGIKKFVIIDIEGLICYNNYKYGV